MRNWIKILPSIILLCWNSGAWAQSVWQKVNSIEELEEGGIFTITAQFSSHLATRYKDKDMRMLARFYRTKNDEEEYYYQPWTLEEQNSFTPLKLDGYGIKKVPGFTFTHIKNGEEDYWLIYDNNFCKYLGVPTVLTQSRTNFLLRKVPNDNNKFVIATDEDGLYIQSGNSRIYANIDAGFFFMKLNSAEANSKHQRAQIYKLTKYCTLNGLEDLAETHIEDEGEKEVLLYREMVEGKNTLILPCNVEDYQYTFGENTTAYEFASSGSSEITFSKVSGVALKANTPYLIVGEEFEHLPFVIGKEGIEFDGESDQVKAFAGGKIHGVYKNRTLPEENAYFIYQSTFYNTKPYTDSGYSIDIMPYKWYIEEDEAPASKRMVLSELPTSIPAVGHTMGQAAVHTISGQKIEGPIQSLPRGIYIIDGRKHIVR